MFCSRCGTENPDAGSFCVKCGAPLRPQAQPSPAGGDDAAWRAVIGKKNLDYYLPRFRDQQASGRRALWHWPAFFVTLYWLLYRKLWGWAAAYFFLPAVVAALLGVMAATGRAGQTIAGLGWLVFLALFFIAPPMLANSLYYSRCAKLLASERAAAQGTEQLLARLEAKGGTSSAALIVVLAVFPLIAVVGILAAVAVPAYSDYTKRAKSSEAIISGMSVARQVGDVVERTGRLPPSLEALAEGSRSPYVSAMRLNPSNGVIDIDVNFGPGQPGGMISLTPGTGPDGKVTWRCSAEPRMTRYVPASCRAQ